MTLEEYELYELTKPSFILNVNFSTEAKHRDVLESLILGRVGKIKGGDVPPNKRYIKWNRANSFFAGFLIDNTATIYVGTGDNATIFNSAGEVVSASGPPLANSLWPSLKQDLERVLEIEVSDEYQVQDGWTVGDVIKMSEWSEYIEITS